MPCKHVVNLKRSNGYSLLYLQGVQVLTSAQYFAQHWSHVPVVSDLYDSIHQSRQAASTEKGANRASGAYKAHLSAHTVERELNSGTVLQVNLDIGLTCCRVGASTGATVLPHHKSTIV